MHRECFPEEGWKILGSLKGIAQKHKAVLAGGTALALHLGHRVSVDLDFFTDSGFRTETVITEMRKTGKDFRLMAEADDYLIADIEGVKISLFQYAYPFLEKPHAYEGIQIAGILDIASMKIIAISQRGTKRDFVDLYAVLQDIPFHRIAEHMVKRFGRERLSPVHIGKSLVYFSDAESNPDPAYIKGREITWEEVRKFFRGHVKQFVYDFDEAVRRRGSAS
ncbi:MAG: nucleotidyl transferase AbiEii/AbiGii toxin family protein [Nitrospirae bacterium]|nr:nucleotidyl transferase AbiEii/AbiGii toxin family protein [Nitrospirota bacterium]